MMTRFAFMLLVAATATTLTLGCSNSADKITAAADTTATTPPPPPPPQPPPPPPPPPPVPAPPDTGYTRVPIAGAFGIALAHDFAYITQTLQNSVARLDLGPAKLSGFVPIGRDACRIVFNSTATRAYVANQFSDDITIIDVPTNRAIGTIPVTGDPLPVALGDDTTLFVTTNVNRLFRINVPTKTVTGFIDLPATSHYLLVHPNGSLLYVATRDAGSVLEINWHTMTVVRTFHLGGRTQGMALSEDNKELYVANELSNALQIVWLPTGSVDEVPLAGGGEGLARDANGKLYVGLVFNGQVQVVDPAISRVLRTITMGGLVREVVFDPIRRKVLVSNEDGWLDIIH